MHCAIGLTRVRENNFLMLNSNKTEIIIIEQNMSDYKLPIYDCTVVPFFGTHTCSACVCVKGFFFKLYCPAIEREYVYYLKTSKLNTMSNRRECRKFGIITLHSASKLKTCCFTKRNGKKIT